MVEDLFSRLMGGAKKSEGWGSSGGAKRRFSRAGQQVFAGPLAIPSILSSCPNRQQRTTWKKGQDEQDLQDSSKNDSMYIVDKSSPIHKSSF